MVEPAVLKQYIESSGLTYHQNSISYIFTCPRCNKKDKLYLRKRDGRFCCWRCREIDNFQGRPEFALSELLCLPLQVVRAKLYGERQHEAAVSLDVRLTDFFDDDDIIDFDAKPITPIEWPFGYYPIDHKHSVRGAQYLESRGIPLSIALEYGLRYCPEKRRVVFPIHSNGELVGYQERTVLPQTKIWQEEEGKYVEIQKVLSNRGIPRDRTLMFTERLRNRDYAVLCEGPIDALKAHLCGGNVASMGKAVSTEQLLILRNQIRLLQGTGIKRLYLALDPDAYDETMRLVRDFGDIEVYHMAAPKPYKDIGAMSMEAVKDLFDSAPRVNAGHLIVYFKPLNVSIQP